MKLARHVPDGKLRRLLDEPLAVPDRDVAHAESCGRCRRRLQAIAHDAASAHRLLVSPVAVSDLDLAWANLAARRAGPRRARLSRGGPRRRWRLAGTSLGTGASVAAAGLAVAGIAAAATLTTVFAPTSVAPVPVSKADLQPLTALLRLAKGPAGAFAQPTGSSTLPFGTLSWTSSGRGKEVSSLAVAEAATGLSVSLPASLPSGVGAPSSYFVAPRLTATVDFNSSAGPALSGSALVVTIGPGIAVGYSSPTGASTIMPLAVAAAARPVATSTGATTGELEAFLLSQPGVPSDLADELRLLANPSATLPVPVPPGTSSSTVGIDGSEAVLLTDPSRVASGAIWVSGGDVHVVAGLLDEKDLLGVARQVG